MRLKIRSLLFVLTMIPDKVSITSYCTEYISEMPC